MKLLTSSRNRTWLKKWSTFFISDFSPQQIQTVTQHPNYLEILIAHHFKQKLNYFNPSSIALSIISIQSIIYYCLLLSSFTFLLFIKYFNLSCISYRRSSSVKNSYVVDLFFYRLESLLFSFLNSLCRYPLFLYLKVWFFMIFLLFFKISLWTLDS